MFLGKRNAFPRKDIEDALRVGRVLENLTAGRYSRDLRVESALYNRGRIWSYRARVVEMRKGD